MLRDKRIKALVVRSFPVKGDLNRPADLKLIQETGAEMHREVREFDPVQNRMRNRGTSYLVQIMDDYDLLPVHNFKYGSHPDTPKINGDVWEKRLTQGLTDGCWYGCTVACAHAVDGYEVKTGPYKGQTVIVDSPEYETLAGVGSNCGIFDPEAILEIAFYCDTYGLDTISVGVAIATLMEASERGLITEHVPWGDPEAVVAWVERIARKEGLGGQIAELGLENWARSVGADFVMTIKGVEVPMHDPRGKMGLGIQYATSSKGATHCDGFHDHAYIDPSGAPELGIPGGLERTGLEGKAPYIVLSEDWRTVVNSAVCCYFTMRENGPVRNIEDLAEDTCEHQDRRARYAARAGYIEGPDPEDHRRHRCRRRAVSID